MPQTTDWNEVSAICAVIGAVALVGGGVVRSVLQGHEGRIARIEGDVHDLKSDQASIRSEVSDIKAGVGRIEGKLDVLLGGTQSPKR